MTRRSLLDVNVLIALAEPAHSHHRSAQDWFNSLGETDWAVCPFTEAGFIRVTTSPAFRPVPRTVAEATAVLQRIKDLPHYCFWEIDESWATLTAPFASRISGHQQVTDAYLLGLAMRHNGVLVTFDTAIQKLAGAELSSYIHLLR